jgi:succinate dehydrogenase/fumarate reductase iron-sulfur protein
MILKVYRSGEGGKESHYDSFFISPVQGMTVLAALFEIREKYDESLAFRYSCRGAVCGTCGMLINKVPRLACRTQIGSLIAGTDVIEFKSYPALETNIPWDPEKEVLVEPMPHLPVIKDLIVDMTKFFECYRLTDPVLRPSGKVPRKEWKMEPDVVTSLERYTNCILCASCFGACPVNSRNPEYMGPAALAKLYRFHIDPREARDGSRLIRADKPSGWWACEFHSNCTKVCPRYVPPDIAIGNARKELQKLKKSPD